MPLPQKEIAPVKHPALLWHQTLSFHRPSSAPYLQKPAPSQFLLSYTQIISRSLLPSIAAIPVEMNAPAHSSPFMDIDSPSYSRWSYATSNARSEPGIVHTTMPQARTTREVQPVRCPPPTAAPPSPVQTSPGIWEDEDGVYYASNWSPVQEYLDRIREERRMLVAPSEIIFVLAALDIVYSPWDIAHWIFWPSATYYNTADRVTAIALHQPKLIVTKIPWIGSREHRWIVNAIQEKYYYVHILGRWYPTDFQPLETKKRTLRSSGGIEDRLDMTVNQFFNIVEDGLPPSKRQRRPPRKIAEPQVVLADKRSRGAPQRKSTITTHSEQTPLENVPTPRSDVSTSVTNPRSSGHDKRQASPPATHTAAIGPTDSEVNPKSSFTSDISLSASHSRNRSTSQSSEQTVVAEDQDQRRSVSVESATTAVTSSSLSKKRKAEALDELIEETDQQQSEESAPAEGMITRGRSKITGIVSGVEDVKKPSTRLSPITRRTKFTPKAKSKKTRS